MATATDEDEQVVEACIQDLEFIVLLLCIAQDCQKPDLRVRSEQLAVRLLTSVRDRLAQIVLAVERRPQVEAHLAAVLRQFEKNRVVLPVA